MLQLGSVISGKEAAESPQFKYVSDDIKFINGTGSSDKASRACLLKYMSIEAKVVAVSALHHQLTVFCSMDWI